MDSPGAIWNPAWGVSDLIRPFSIDGSKLVISGAPGIDPKDGEEVVGSETRVKVVKNKVAPPFRQAEFEILYGEGSSREGELIELGVNHNLVDKSGAWYSYNGERIGQGKDNTRLYLKEHPEIAAAIDAQLRAKLLNGGALASSTRAEEVEEA